MAAIAAPGIESPSAKLIARSWSHCAACSIVSGISAEWSGFSAAIGLEAGDVAAAPARRAALPFAHRHGVGTLLLGMEERPGQERNEAEGTNWSKVGITQKKYLWSLSRVLPATIPCIYTQPVDRVVPPSRALRGFPWLSGSRRVRQDHDPGRAIWLARAVAQEPASGHDGACMVGHSERHLQNLIRCAQRAIPRCNFSAARG